MNILKISIVSGLEIFNIKPSRYFLMWQLAPVSHTNLHTIYLLLSIFIVSIVKTLWGYLKKNMVVFFFFWSICSKVFERSCVLCCNPLQWLPEFKVFALVVRQLWRAMSLWKSWATVRAALPLSERRNLPSHHWRMLLPCWMDGKKLHTGGPKGWRSGGQRESDWENKRQKRNGEE